MEGIAYYVYANAPPVDAFTCIPDPIGRTGYSLVFKGCVAKNVAEYYDKTECVRDNATGLIWQGHTRMRTNDFLGDLRAGNLTRTNYDSTTALQAYSYELDKDVAPTQSQIDDISNSIGFKNAVNATNLCGSSAWRLPSKDELLGIVKTTEIPTIDNSWFPNSADWYYWTSTPSQYFVNGAWSVSFKYGTAHDGLVRNFSNGGFIVRLVR